MLEKASSLHFRVWIAIGSVAVAAWSAPDVQAQGGNPFAAPTSALDTLSESSVGPVSAGYFAQDRARAVAQPRRQRQGGMNFSGMGGNLSSLLAGNNSGTSPGGGGVIARRPVTSTVIMVAPSARHPPGDGRSVSEVVDLPLEGAPQVLE